MNSQVNRGTVHIEKLGQNFLANVDKHNKNVDAVKRRRSSWFQRKVRVMVIAEVMVGIKVVIKGKVLVRTVEPVTYLEDILPLERSVTIVV